MTKAEADILTPRERTISSTEYVRALSARCDAEGIGFGTLVAGVLAQHGDPVAAAQALCALGRAGV